MKQKIKTILAFFIRKIKKVDWCNLRSVKPISRGFGFKRGTPVDRVYIEDFLSKNKENIQGTVLEIADSTYSKKFGTNVSKYEILHIEDKEGVTIVSDLSKPETLPENAVDCFICTQTLNFIYPFKDAIVSIHRILKPGGIALVTVSGISQISRYDADRWGDYWRFNTMSMKRAFSEVFGEKNVIVDYYGNVLTATAILQGISAEELKYDELMYKDKDYQVTITVMATKYEANN